MPLNGLVAPGFESAWEGNRRVDQSASLWFIFLRVAVVVVDPAFAASVSDHIEV